MNGQVVLRVEGLDKSLGKQSVLKQLNLTAERGERLGIIGENGAGKTTFIKVAASVLKADRGRFFLNGAENPSSPRWKSQVAWVPQDIALDPELTVRDNLKFWTGICISDKSARREALDKAYRDPLVCDFLDKKVRSLSGGMARRANLCCAVFGTPALLLLDEPFAGADEDSLRIMRQRLLQLSEEGTCLLICSHDLPLLKNLCTRLLELKDGHFEEVEAVK